MITDKKDSNFLKRISLKRDQVRHRKASREKEDLGPTLVEKLKDIMLRRDSFVGPK